jgi:tripartite-type tricarboxylate transporter receptor subunit TctC
MSVTKWTRRTALAGIAAATLGSQTALAQGDAAAGFPRQPIKMLVPFAAGGGNDIIARVVAQKLSERLGQPVTVENRAGGAGFIAVNALLAAPADGYTLLVAPNSVMVFNAALYAKLPYDPLKSFAPITVMAAFPFYVTVSADQPFKTLQELVAWGKANPAKANYGGTSGVFQLVTEQFKQLTGTPFEYVPFKSTAEVAAAVLNGQVTMAFIDPAPLLPHLKAGKVRLLAISTPKRSPDNPDVPTMAEAGVKGVELEGFSGLVARAGTPAAIVKKLADEVNAIIKLADVQERFKSLAVYPVGGSSEAFTASVAKQIPIWQDVAKKANIKLE